MQIFIFVMIIMLFVLFKDGVKNIEFTNIDYMIDIKNYNWLYIIKGLIISITVSLLVLIALYFIFNEKYRHLKNRQKIARMMMSNKFYDEDSVTVNKLNGGTKQKRVITYFPKVFYKKNGAYIEIRFSLDMSRYQKRFMNLSDELENGLFCTVTDKIGEEDYICYELMYDVEKQRINIDDVEVENGKMKLMKHIFWEFDSQPHMLISGGTGSGKTFFILTIINALVDYRAELKILDPKNADLADLEEITPEKTVYSQKNGIKMSLNKARKEMEKRSEDMKFMSNYKTGSNYADVGMKPYFVVFDEYVAFLEMLNHKEKAEVLEDMKQLTMLGRQSGVFLILANQRPDAKYLSDGIRDQFNFRVALGRNSAAGYNMMFGDVDNNFVNKKTKGRGYLDSGDSIITEFYTPLVPKGYNFQNEIEKSYRKRRVAVDATASSDSG